MNWLQDLMLNFMYVFFFRLSQVVVFLYNFLRSFCFTDTVQCMSFVPVRPSRQTCLYGSPSFHHARVFITHWHSPRFDISINNYPMCLTTSRSLPAAVAVPRCHQTSVDVISWVDSPLSLVVVTLPLVLFTPFQILHCSRPFRRINGWP